MAICKAEKNALRKTTNKVTEIVRHYTNFVDVMKTSMNFAISFEEEYNKKFVATANLDIMKELMRSDFLRARDAQLFHGYILFAKMLLSHEREFTPVEILTGDYELSTSLAISHLEDIDCTRRPRTT